LIPRVEKNVIPAKAGIQGYPLSGFLLTQEWQKVIQAWSCWFHLKKNYWKD